jgi:sensor histidine kinase regulating citrate/malate metabolism
VTSIPRDPINGFSTKEFDAGLGRGIGLALVRRVTTRLDGRVTVTDGLGPVFTVTLPLAQRVGARS